ncbi:9132_t:CDS:2 [Funneliformis caledonium]|uniref:9132_t:CDS:1 n=1 Tax=Funneliformis caledonium TaxID=1117310 RepID=A0A9N8YP75_9GLOM|nr:9132_t:CDS:2 [Funneliformis caledonium]
MIFSSDYLVEKLRGQSKEIKKILEKSNNVFVSDFLSNDQY